MSEQDFQNKERFNALTYKGSKYYDHPDGEDLLGKLAYTTKIAAVVSSIFGILNANVPPVPKTTSGKIVRVMKIVAPGVGMAAAFTFVTYFSTVVRKKDDQWNYVLGAMAAGGVVTAARPSFGIFPAIYLSIAAFTKKSHQMHGMDMLPKIGSPKQFSPYFQRKLDFSLIAERKGNWTRDPAPK